MIRGWLGSGVYWMYQVYWWLWVEPARSKGGRRGGGWRGNGCWVVGLSVLVSVGGKRCGGLRGC